MVVYFDLRKKPLFGPYFEQSGVRHANHFRSKTAAMMGRIRQKKVPKALLYADPICPPGDDRIIVFDSLCSDRYLQWVRERHPDKRLILWYWNPVPGHLITGAKELAEVWTYSSRDSKEYGLRLNTQFYFDCLAEEASGFHEMPKTDHPHVLFIGREKGRSAQLADLKLELEEAGAETDLRIYSPPNVWKKAVWLFEDLMPYREVTDLVRESDVLLDLNSDPGAGLSLRAMEALFWNKKLITNTTEIAEADFYDPHNIYILGKEERTFREFLEEEFRPADPGIRDRYLLSRWLDRFE